MSHTRIEMDTMAAIERACARQEKQVEALVSIAKDLRDIREFLLGTTLRDLDKKTKVLRKESQEANKKKQASNGSD